MQPQPMQPITFLPGVRYDGSAEYAQLWDDYTRAYTQNGSSKSRIQAANLLNDLAFGNGGVATLVARYDPASSQYRHAKQDIEEAAMALSQRSQNDRDRALNHAVIASLTSQWIEQERQHDLYPPQSIAAHDGVKKEDKERIIANRHALLREAPAALVASALRMAVNTPIEIKAQEIWQRLQSRDVQHQEVLDQMEDIFENSLFTYRNDQNASFMTWVLGGQDRYLWRDTVKEQERHPTGASLDQELSDEGDPMVGFVPDHHELPPEENAMRHEQLQRIRHIINNYVRFKEDRQVLRLRFGLRDGRSRTLDQVAEVIGVSKERVRQRQNRAFEELEEGYQAEYGESLHDFFLRHYDSAPSDQEPIQSPSADIIPLPQSRLGTINQEDTMPEKAVTAAAPEGLVGAIDAYKQSFGHQIMTRREERNMNREVLADAVTQLVRTETEAVTGDKINLWEKSRGTLPTEAQFAALEQILILENEHVQDKENAQRGFRDAYDRAQRARKKTDASKPSSRASESDIHDFGDLVQSYREGMDIKRDELAQRMQARLSLAVTEEEQAALERDKGIFIAAIEAGQAPVSRSLSRALVQGLDAQRPLQETEKQELYAAYARSAPETSHVQRVAGSGGATVVDINGTRPPRTLSEAKGNLFRHFQREGQAIPSFNKIAELAELAVPQVVILMNQDNTTMPDANRTLATKVEEKLEKALDKLELGDRKDAFRHDFQALRSFTEQQSIVAGVKGGS